MKRLFTIAFCLCLFMAGPASGRGVSLVGTWEGTYDSIRPDGSEFLGLSMSVTILKQSGALLQGIGTYQNPDKPTEILGPFPVSGIINTKKEVTATGFLASGLVMSIHGKLSGKTISATIINPVDGSTSIFTLRRIP